MIMVFNSIFFIFCFLPLFLLVYYMVPARFQNPVLFAGSLIFYAWGNPVYIPLLLFSSFFNYYMGLEMERLSASPKSRKRNLVFTVVVNLLILGFFKYSGFLLDLAGSLFGFTISHPQLSLPIGISFFTFKNLSYIFDIYREKVDAQHNFLTFSVYSTMFPHMSAGPIVRYADIREQLDSRSISIPKLGVGAE